MEGVSGDKVGGWVLASSCRKNQVDPAILPGGYPSYNVPDPRRGTRTLAGPLPAVFAGLGPQSGSARLRVQGTQSVRKPLQVNRRRAGGGTARAWGRGRGRGRAGPSARR